MLKAPPDLVGRGVVEAIIVAILPRARPQQRVAFATFIVEQVGVDGRGEGGVVKLE